uniref:uncharacterized protein LOC122582995 n=1 Tax=Erigeron canadensis TaxID=72917 RepID=UPI001CB9D090|nr:uncharacterized protein LOC122582995 [Erigeron canadensis]
MNLYSSLNSMNETNNNSISNRNPTNLGFHSPPPPPPPPVGPAGLGSNLSRPRLMKMRKQTSSYNHHTNNPRFTPHVDSGLGFNPFRTGSSTFSFGAGSSSSSSNVVDSGSVLDDLRKMQIDSDESVSNFKFKFNAGESEGKKRFDESLADQLPKEVDKLKIGESGNVGSVKSRVMNPFSGNVEMDLHNEIDKMNLGKMDGKAFVFGKSKEDLISDKMGELKVGGGRVDKEKMFVFGSNRKTGDGFAGRSEGLNSEERFNKEEVKDDLISNRMRELKVGGAGENFVFGQNVELEKQKVNESASSSSQHQPFGNVSFTSRPEKNVGFTFSSKVDNIGAANFEFKMPDNKGDLFSGVKSIPESRLKKKKGKVRKPVISQPRPKQDFVFGQRSSPEISESFEAYSPMDASPYQETLADNYSRGTSVTSDDATFQINDQNSVCSDTNIINSNITTDEDLLAATQRLNVNDGDDECEVSESETFKSAMENLDFSSDSFATAFDSDLSSTATSGSSDKTGTRLYKFGSKLENISNDNFTFAASTSGQGQLSPDARQHKKKHRLKTGQDSYSPRSDTQNSYASSSSSSILSSVRTQKVDTSTLSSKTKDNYKPINKHHLKNETFSTASASIAAEEACEKWRLRGNQAYGSGELAKAEDYYTQGLNSVSETEKSKGCLRALMLCYSNRAATRISLGRMKDALKDCLMAAAIDPNFVKVQVRAAYCYLAIGEVEKATLQYMKCLQSGSDVCVDRKLLVEASEGLEKAQKVTECLKQYNELSRNTPDAIESGLRVINEALQISSYSEQLLQMKADNLLMLRRYEQIIQLCEQTLSSAEIETPTSSSSWRSNLIVKSYFYLGRLEEAYEFIKKQESSDHITERLESMRLESVIPLADTIRELLSRKAAGNETYKARKFTDAVEQYTSAIACSIESRPFAAICFCNRAAAYRALGQITDAIADCSLAIALDPSYLKAVSRRASLYEMIRDYGQAAIDLRKSVSILTSQMEEKGILSGVSDKSSVMNELRQTQLRLYHIEEESRKGIPLNMYLILGVESTAAASEVKKAYRKAALKHHPDKAALSVSRCDNGDDGVWKEIAVNVHKDADRLFKMIGEAYAVLSNPSKRAEYDMDEDMRNEVNKFTRSSSGRMAADVQSPVFERSGSRQWQDSFRPFVDSQSKSYRYSRYS